MSRLYREVAAVHFSSRRPGVTADDIPLVIADIFEAVTKRALAKNKKKIGKAIADGDPRGLYETVINTTNFKLAYDRALTVALLAGKQPTSMMGLKKIAPQIDDIIFGDVEITPMDKVASEEEKTELQGYAEQVAKEYPQLIEQPIEQPATVETSPTKPLMKPSPVKVVDKLKGLRTKDTDEQTIQEQHAKVEAEQLSKGGVEFHYPGGYNYLGPGTNLADKFYNDKILIPLNTLDYLAMAHDFQYISKNENTRRIADIRFLKGVSKLWDEKKISAVDVIVSSTMIEYKNILEDVSSSSGFFTGLAATAAALIAGGAATPSALVTSALATTVAALPIKKMFLKIDDEKEYDDFSKQPVVSDKSRKVFAHAIKALQNYIVASGNVIDENTGQTVKNEPKKSIGVVEKYKSYALKIYLEAIKMNTDDAEGKTVIEPAWLDTNPALSYGSYDKYGKLTKGSSPIIGKDVDDAIGVDEDDHEPSNIEPERPVDALLQAEPEVLPLESPVDALPQAEPEVLPLESPVVDLEPVAPVAPVTTTSPAPAAPATPVAPVAPVAPDGVTEKVVHVPAPEGKISGEAFEGEARASILQAGSNSVKMTEEEDLNNENRILYDIILQGTEYEDRNNSLKIKTAQSEWIKYHKSNILAPSNDASPGKEAVAFATPNLKKTSMYIGRMGRYRRNKQKFRLGKAQHVQFVNLRAFASRLGSAGIDMPPMIQTGSNIQLTQNYAPPKFTRAYIQSASHSKEPPFRTASAAY